MDISNFVLCREKQNIIIYDPVDTVLKHLGKKTQKQRTNKRSGKNALFTHHNSALKSF